jgi:hypothetical protein
VQGGALLLHQAEEDHVQVTGLLLAGLADVADLLLLRRGRGSANRSS